MLKFFIVILFMFTLVYGARTRALIQDDFPDDASNATIIPLNTDIRGGLNTNNDIDWLKFTINTPDGIELSLDKNDTGSVGAYLFDEYTIIHGGTSIIGVRLSPYEDPNIIHTSITNLVAGTYYIKILDSTYGSIVGYRVKIKSSDNTSVGWVPDAVTVEYCKNNPSKCGIKAKIIILPL